MSRRLERLAAWWDEFASTEVGSIEGISGRATLESAESVAAALRAWHEGGAAGGDLAFWRQHVEQFRSPKAYALVVDALLEQRDLVAAMALLIQWLSQSSEIALIEQEIRRSRIDNVALLGEYLEAVRELALQLSSR